MSNTSKRISEGMTYGEVVSDRMTFGEVLSAHPRVRGIFEAYGVYETGTRNLSWKKETLGSIAISLKSTPERFLNQIASCIKAPVFPLGNVFVLFMATMAFGLSFGLWVLMGPLSAIIKTEFNLSYTQNSIINSYFYISHKNYNKTLSGCCM
ncbi:MAG: hypothetical protein SCARUB_00599 [Candidatus Scalindua rubra]|uniref:Uncharacterized protein n=1 Tax=Candidatus Scalindua rubra TaxID=1872076 RepID=A0A1E3XF23_9BACT|nr:MAG: hypothetical protein SCARUB_00599 [Candidatus Scalindua rubra]